MKRLVICFVLLACVIPFACKKSNSSGDPTLSFGIRGLGAYCVGYPMCFSESPINATSYLWNFGDGTTSTDAAPCHTYADTGTYNVKLTVNNYISQTQQLQVHIGTQPIYTYLLNGEKTWRHQLGTHFNPSNTTSLYAAPDTSFSIVSINATTIVVGNDTLNYKAQTVYNNNVLYFDRSSPGGAVYNDVYKELCFKHGATDSISYYIFYDQSPGASALSYFFAP